MQPIKHTIIILITAAALFPVNGCKKKETLRQEPNESEIKTTAEYEAEARREINKDNMAEELDKIEKAVDLEAQ